jgi:hypothetical protein
VRFARTGWIAATTARIAGVAAILLAACGPTRAPDGVPLDERELIAAGDRIDQEIERAGLVFDDPVLARYLSEVTARLEPGADHALRVRVIRQSTANAVALPNGSIWLTVSLLANVTDEPQLALVLGHEIAHLERRHPIAALRDRKRKPRVPYQRHPAVHCPRRRNERRRALVWLGHDRRPRPRGICTAGPDARDPQGLAESSAARDGATTSP